MMSANHKKVYSYFVAFLFLFLMVFVGFCVVTKTSNELIGGALLITLALSNMVKDYV